jgi:hypothetical protein
MPDFKIKPRFIGQQDLTPYQSIMGEMALRAAKMQEDILLKIVTKVLGREPMIEDYPSFGIIKQLGGHDKFLFTYKGEPIGSVKYCFEGMHFIVMFDPNDKKF